MCKRKSGRDFDFLFCLLAILGLYLVGELTHMRSMCVGVAETGVGAYDDPRRYLKKLFSSRAFA